MENILYCRVSTKKQEASLVHQKELSLSILNSSNIYIHKVYEEVSSAFKGKQNMLNEILTSYQNINLYILNISRFSRNLEKAINFIKLAKTKNITIFFIEEELNTSSFEHQHRIRSKLSLSQYESEMIGERSRKRSRMMRDMGYQIGKAKYGFKKSNKRARLERDNKEQSIITLVNTLRNSQSCKSVNDALKQVNPRFDPIEFLDRDGITVIEYFDKTNTLNYQNIADLLNDYGIMKRNKMWTANSVSSLIVSDKLISKGLKNLSI